MRTLTRLELEAALRHPTPENPGRDPVCAALGGAGLARLIKHKTSRVTSAWLGTRDAWFDATVRRQVLPGHARIALVGAGLDPRCSRFPQGLLGDGLIVMIDRPEVLEARRARLSAAGLAEPAQVRYVEANPEDAGQVLQALGACVGDAPGVWSIFAVGLFGLWGLEGVGGFIEELGALRRQPEVRVEKMLVGFDWFGPEHGALPEEMRALLPGKPLAMQPLGLEVWLKATAAVMAETVCLLHHGPREVGFGTWVEL